MRRYGKIALYAIWFLFVFTTVALWQLPKQARAATWGSVTFYIPDKADYGFTDIDDAYAIITDIRTGDMYSTAGAVSATWTDCDIAFTQDVENPYWSGCTIPALPRGKDYAITIYEDVGGDGSEAATDPVRIDAVLWSAQAGVPYTDTNPVSSEKVRVVNN